MLIEIRKRAVKFFQNRSLILAIVLFVGGCLPLSVFSQQTNPKEILQTLNLNVSKGKIEIHFAAGYEHRAKEVRPLIEEMIDFYQERLDLRQQFSVAILTKEQWTKNLGLIPYGLPFVRDNVAFLPATNDGAITAGAIAMRPIVSAATKKKIRDSGYDFDAAAMKFTDIIGLHELGHVYTHAYGIEPGSKWFTEFLASYFAYAFLQERRPKLARLFIVMAADVYFDGLKSPQFTRLADFERLYLGVGVDNYAWFQGKFLVLGSKVYRKQKLKVLINLKAADIGNNVEFEALEKVSPGIKKWADELKLTD